MRRFVSIEGGDGSGKSTQAGLLAARLRVAGVDVLPVHEPGGTPVGESVRRWVKGAGPSSPVAELLLFEAARAELVRAVIRPALAGGRVVVSDRFADSTVAYQGYGRGLDVDEIRALNRIATGGLAPDATILLDVEPDVALRRVRGPSAGGAALRPGEAGQERFEREPVEFHRRVAEGFRTLAAEEPARWFVIDASRDAEAVAARVWAVVSTVLAI